MPVAFPSGGAVDVSNFPALRGRFRVTERGQPVTLNQGSVYLFESNITLPVTALIPESNGIHVIEWTSLKGSATANLIATHNGVTGAQSIAGSVPAEKLGAKVVVRDSVSRNVPGFLDYGTVRVGETKMYKLKVVATEAPRKPGTTNERPVRLESVTCNSPEFVITWKGSFGASAPPVDIISPLEYRVDVEFTPTKNAPTMANLTVKFEGGLRTDVMLFANPNSYPRQTILRLVSPNGGESVTPCQDIDIVWKGAISSFKSFVEFTVDNGKNWKLIDSTFDSTYVWTVPKEYSDSARIRVFQKFQSTQPVWLFGEQAPATKLAYSADSKYLLVGYGNGAIIEWDVETAQIVQKYSAALGGMQYTAMAYLGQTRDFVAVRTNSGRSGSMLHFSNGVAAPDNSIALPTDFTVREVGTDVQGKTLFVLPYQSARVLRYDAASLTEQSPIIFNAPAQTSTLHGNSISVHSMDGNVIVYDAITGNEIRKSQTGIPAMFGPRTHRMGASLSSRLMALGGQSLNEFNSAREQRTFIYDMQENIIVKVLYREGSDAVSLRFSPNEAYLAMGFALQPQFVAYDLVAGRTLPPSGFADGHENMMTDLAFGPDGSTLVSTSVDSIRNVLMRKVATPESDMSDGVFRIVPPQLSLPKVVFKSLLIGTTTDTTLSASVCNSGPAPIVLESAALQNKTWATLNTNVLLDTLLPGQCITLSLTALPLDTGLLVDTVRFVTCGESFALPLEIISRDRNLTVLTQLEDFGDVCVGKTLSKQITMIRNNDSIGVVINAVYRETGLQSQFRVVNFASDTTIPPGGTLQVTVQFSPTKLGYDTSTFAIRYAGQSAVQRYVRVTGRGSGADIILSHRALPFIPEIPIRELIIRNNSSNPISVDSATITAGNPFTVLTAVPVTILPNDSLLMQVQYNGGAATQGAKLSLSVSPCAAVTDVGLSVYSGSTVITLPHITASPLSDTTSIPINASVTESVAYDGVRFFEGAFTVNPRLFFAHTVTSAVGTGEVLSQSIENGLRVVKFRITGTFRGKMELGRVIGSAGLAEIDSSALVADTAQLNFGSTVITTFVSGGLKIVLLDPNRRVVNSGAPVIQGIYPNPATSSSTVKISHSKSEAAIVSIMNPDGSKASEDLSVVLTAGRNDVLLNTDLLSTGLYYIVVRSGGTAVQSTIAVVH